MSKIVAHVIAAEGQHCHGVAAHNAHSTGGSCGCFRSHGGTDEHAVLPAAGLIYQRSGFRPAPAENHCGNGHALRVVKFRAYTGAVFRRSGKTAVGVGGFFRGCGGVPGVALPVDGVFRRVAVKTFPPNGVVVKIVGNVGKNSVALGCGKGVGI